MRKQRRQMPDVRSPSTRKPSVPLCRGPARGVSFRCSTLSYYFFRRSTYRYQHCFSHTTSLHSERKLTSPAMVADAVIYHPAVSHYLRYVATAGKRSIPELLYLPSRPVDLPLKTLTDGRPHSRSRQDTANSAVLLAVLCMVPLSYQQSSGCNRSIQCYKDTVRPHA
jgi:hypothetical protein